MKGHYSLVQYAETPERLEFINIGVIVFVDDGERVYFQFSDSPNRVKKAFGVSLGKHYDLLIDSLQSRVRDDFSNWKNTSDIERFVVNRSGKVRLTPLRSILLKDPDADVKSLFERLVTEGEVHHRRRRADHKLKALFRFEQVERLLGKPEKIQLKHFSLQPDYGYQNGSYNYIKAVSLHGEPDDALGKVSGYAVKGRWLANDQPLTNRKQLIVIGDSEGQEEDVVLEIRQVLKNHEVQFYPLNQISPLLNDIKKNLADQCTD